MMWSSPQNDEESLLFNKDSPQNMKKSRRALPVIVVFIACAVIFGGFLVWQMFWSPEAVQEKELEKNFELMSSAMEQFEKQMREDTYGGKTPEETLRFFILALEEGDVDLASKYFAVNISSPATTERTKIMTESLKKIKEEQKLGEFIEILKIMKPLEVVQSSREIFLFGVKNKDNLVEYSMILKKNNLSGVWKIESI